MLGLGGAAVLVLASFGAHRPPRAAEQVPPPMRQIVRQRGFVILYAATLLLSTSLFVPFVFIKSYATDEGIDAGAAATLVGIIGASSVVGRLGLGGLGGRFGATRLMQASFVILTASFLIWLAAGASYPMLVLFTIVMGVAYGGFIALAPAVAAGLFGTVGLGAILGTLYTAAAIGGLDRPADRRRDHRPGLLRGRHRRGHGADRRVDGRAVPAAGRPRPVAAPPPVVADAVSP